MNTNESVDVQMATPEGTQAEVIGALIGHDVDR
jgi:hypothetical protein